MSRIPSKRLSRRAFTLIELLVVIAIIATLMGLTLAVLANLMDSAEEEATSATIQKVSRLMEQRYEAFERAYTGARKNSAILAMNAHLSDPNSDGNRADGIFGVSEAVVTILAKKALYRFEFPQRFEERTLFGDPATIIPPLGPSPGMPDSLANALALPAAKVELIAEGYATPTPAQIVSRAQTKWRGGTDSVGKVFATSHDPTTESSELLYYALITSGSYGAASVDGDRFTDREVSDTDNDGLPEFIDSWERPLRFYRWPTRLIDTNPAVPFQPDLADLADPTDVDITPDDIDSDGLREIVTLERNVANLLLKGLPPKPGMMPNGSFSRDLLLTDPDDPVGRLYTELERLDGTDGKPLFAAEFNEAAYHTPDTFHAPLILSAGPDEVLGLYEPNDTTNAGNLAAYDSTLTNAQIIDALSDNITSRNKLSGGRQ